MVVIGATNRPGDLDDAIRRRLTRRVYVPLPDTETREGLLDCLLQGQHVDMGSACLAEIVELTHGYSGSDMASLCKEAAMRPVRELSAEMLITVDVGALRPIALQDFRKALQVVRSSVSTETLAAFESWNSQFGCDVGSLS